MSTKPNQCIWRILQVVHRTPDHMFLLTQESPEEIVSTLYEHNKQEEHYFTTFLPDLYRLQIGG